MATILIVDDLPADREILAKLLRDHGHQVLEASNGRNALAVVQAEHFDLVITDVLMPAMDGFEFVTQLRLDPTTSRIPVLFYTAPYSEREAKDRAVSTGVPWVLTKPPDAEAVLKIISSVLLGAPEARTPSLTLPLTAELDREHLRLGSENFSDHAEDLKTANARLRALINIGLELGQERDPDRLLHKVCVDARDLFGATYVTLGLVDPEDRTVQRVLSCGTDATCGVGAVPWFEAGGAVPGTLGAVLAERRPVRGDNSGGSSAGLELPPLHPDVQAFIAAPLVSPTGVYGWICLVQNEGSSFIEDDEHLVMSLAAQVGRILEKLFLAEGARRRAEELEHEVLERKQAESVARREHERAQRYLDTAEVILLTLDIEGRILLVNRYACSVLGRTAEELHGRDWADTCLPPDIRNDLRTTLQRVLAGDCPVVENAILTKSGERRLVEWRNRLLRDDEGRVIGTFSSGTDITERHQAVEALRTAEERMRFALEAASVGIWDMDYATGLLQWSDILEAQYGLQPGTFGGSLQAFAERVHPEDRERLFETLSRAATSGADFTVRHRSVWPDGTVRWLNGMGRILLGDHGQPLRGIGISQDVTERRALEEQYRQAQKMEAIGQLAGGVAHDFNNLLTVILGFSEMVLEDLPPGDPRQEDIAGIHRAGMRGAGLTRQLLAFSHKQIIEPKLLDLNVIVAEMRTMLGRLIEEDLTVVINAAPEPACVTADRRQMEQIVLNLAVNARDAMKGGGTLTIETTNVDLHEHDTTTHLGVKGGSYVALTVTDTGTGITPQVRAHLFEPFFTTKEVGKGTGLGLATVHSIVERSGGFVEVATQVGKGTSFTVYFPRADAEVVVDPPQPVAWRRAVTETVLVVEDEAELREVVRKMLTHQGYTVRVAANAEEAVQVFEQYGSIDVLLTDVVMPGASGPELTRQLVERYPPLKVIYMSGYTDATIAQRGLLNPGIALLHKPFTSETLGRKIREALDR